MNIDQCKTFLFQGDSITDFGRNRDGQNNANDSGALGPGYAGLIASNLLADYPGRQLRIFNRGISGNRVVDLYARWKCDAINLAPDCLSILIGINDIWHEFGSQNGVEIDRYEQVYRMLLEFTKSRLPETVLVLCQPFTLKCGAVTPEWEPDVAQRREIVARLAKEFGAIHVPFQEMFDEAVKEAAPEYWAQDGVHPTPAGHARMARCWRQAVGV